MWVDFNMYAIYCTTTCIAKSGFGLKYLLYITNYQVEYLYTCIEIFLLIQNYLGDFPEELKLAKVIPIYKADNEQHIQNYRPISVLPFFKNTQKGHL